MTLTFDLENWGQTYIYMVFKVNRQGHAIYFGLFEIPDLEYVEIDTKIKSVPCKQPEIQEVT